MLLNSKTKRHAEWAVSNEHEFILVICCLKPTMQVYVMSAFVITQPFFFDFVTLIGFISSVLFR